MENVDIHRNTDGKSSSECSSDSEHSSNVHATEFETPSVEMETSDTVKDVSPLDAADKASTQLEEQIVNVNMEGSDSSDDHLQNGNDLGSQVEEMDCSNSDQDDTSLQDKVKDEVKELTQQTVLEEIQTSDTPLVKLDPEPIHANLERLESSGSDVSLEEKVKESLHASEYSTDAEPKSDDEPSLANVSLGTVDDQEYRTSEVYISKEKETVVEIEEAESPELKPSRNPSSLSIDHDQEIQTYTWTEKAVALKNFVKATSAITVSNVFRRLSGEKDDTKTNGIVDGESDEEETDKESKEKDAFKQTAEGSTWNPLNFIKNTVDSDGESKAPQGKDLSLDCPNGEAAMKGRIIVYTRLGCQECRKVRLFLHQKRLRYKEINIDIYPSRKHELERNTGSSSVPRVYFNDLLIGALADLEALDESGTFSEKVNYVLNGEPSPAAPLPPLPGEDDNSGNGTVDELATVVKKMKEAITVRDRFYKLRRFTKCFSGSEAVDFLAEDQYMEREDAVEYGRKLANNHFFRHVLEENVFEDGKHLYRFLEHDPVVATQCYNIPRGTLDVKPKPIAEIASRLRFLFCGILDAYASEDGKHIDYRSIHESEEFGRYLRLAEELQRVDLYDMSREEKLAFFINLYNMMVIHATLTWGHPAGALDRRRFFGDFKYVIGGFPYSLSMIQNGILRGNQRPPYSLIRPFGPTDKRCKVAVQYVEPLIHFALVPGTRSGPALRYYSSKNIDQELAEAAQNFLRNGGLIVDVEAKTASISKTVTWFSMDFGKTEVEVIKHAANYLESPKSEEVLGLLADSQLKVTDQPYDWSQNC